MSIRWKLLRARRVSGQGQGPCCSAIDTFERQKPGLHDRSAEGPAQGPPPTPVLSLLALWSPCLHSDSAVCSGVPGKGKEASPPGKLGEPGNCLVNSWGGSSLSWPVSAHPAHPAHMESCQEPRLPPGCAPRSPGLSSAPDSGSPLLSHPHFLENLLGLPRLSQHPSSHYRFAKHCETPSQPW